MAYVFKLMFYFMSFSTIMNSHQPDIEYHLEDGIIYSVMNYFNSGCVFLFNTPSHGTTTEARTINLQKRLFHRGVSTVAQSPSTHVSPQCSRNRPLNVLLDSTDALLHTVSVLSDSIWLLLLDKIYLDDFVLDVNIPFDCEFLVAEWSSAEVMVLTEVYRVAKDLTLQSDFFGTWSPEQGLTGPKQSFYNRRSDLQGLPLFTGVLQDWPAVSMNNTGKTSVVRGYVETVYYLLRKQMNFSTIKVLPRRGGMWAENFLMLARGEINISMASMYMTPARLPLVDFTMPLMVSELRIFIRRPDSLAVTWDMYLSPFAPQLWLIFGIITLLLAVFFRLITSVGERRPFIHVLLDVFGSLFCAQGQTLLHTSNGHLLLTLCYLTGLILLAAYSGALTSLLSVRRYNLPFTTLQGLRDDGTFQLGVLNGSTQHHNFKYATGGLLRDLYIRQMSTDKENFPPNTSEAKRRVCTTKYAFLEMDLIMKAGLDTSNKYACDMVALPEVYTTGSLCMGLSKGNPYRGLINHNLQKFRGTGVLNLVGKHIFPDMIKQQGDTGFSGMSLPYVVSLLTLLTTAVTLAALLLMMEVLWRCLNLDQGKRNENRKKVWKV